MRDGNWVLIMDETKTKVELHDVVADRAQSQNLADKEPDRVAHMKAAIEKWFATLPTSINPALQSKVTPKKSPRLKVPNNPQETRARAFKNWDKNQDDHLTLEEYRNGLTDKSNAESRFKNFDSNRDGVLDRDEFVTPKR